MRPEFDNDDIPPLKDQLLRHKKCLESSIASNAYERVRACKSAMCDYLSEFSMDAVGNDITLYNQLRREIITILREADTYLADRPKAKQSVVSDCKDRITKNCCEPIRTPKKPAKRKFADLSSTLVQRTQSLREIREKMEAYRLSEMDRF